MRAELASLGISILAMALAAVVFFAAEGWLAFAAPLVVALAGFAIAALVFRRFADPATKRADLEERTRNEF